MIADSRPAVRYVNVGVDVGQLHDPTTIAVSDLSRRSTGMFKPGYVPGGEIAGQWYGSTYAHDAVVVFDTVYDVRHMERIALGTSYPAVARRLVEILANLARMRLAGTPRLERAVYMDITGVGRPVYDMFVEILATERLSNDVPVYGMTFTTGDQSVYDRDKGRVSKAHLASRLQALMQGQCIGLPVGNPETRVAAEQMKKYEIHASASGVKTGAFEAGSHDDYPTAIGLSCLEDPYVYMAGPGPAFWE